MQVGRRPASAGVGRRRPASANFGQLRPTSANLQPRPASAGDGRRRSASIGLGRPRSASVGRTDGLGRPRLASVGGGRNRSIVCVPQERRSNLGKSLARLFPKLASALGVLDSAKIGCQGGRARAFEENPRRQPGAMSAAPSAAGLAVVAPPEIGPTETSLEWRIL